MPPRKRMRVSQHASPTPPSQPKTPTRNPSPDKDEQLLNDPWTDKEEVGLFKGLIRHKPTGIHKHFRLLALHQYMLDNDFIHPLNKHTKPAGIWQKLQSLYDLEALDAREDARQLSDLSLEDKDEEEEEEDEGDDIYSEAENKIHNDDFSLPDDEYGEMKWQRRFATGKQKRDESPLLLPEINLADVPPIRFTPAFSVEPSETATPSGRGARSRGAAPKRGKGGVAQSHRRRRSTRHADVAADEAEDVEEDGDENGEGDEEGSEEEDEGGDAGEEEKSEKGSTAARPTRTGKGTRDQSGRERGTKRGRRGK